jgi:hypothetical protein
MARSPKRVSAAVSGLMGVQPRWEPGPGIRVIDTEFCGERWIVEAEASGEARCPSPHLAADTLNSTEFATDPPIARLLTERALSARPGQQIVGAFKRRPGAGQRGVILCPYLQTPPRAEAVGRKRLSPEWFEIHAPE